MDRGEQERALSAIRASNLGGEEREGGGGRKGKRANVRPFEDGREKGEVQSVGGEETRVEEGTWKNASLRINGGVATTMHSPDIQAPGQLVRYSTDRISGQIIRFSFFVTVSPPFPLSLLFVSFASISLSLSLALARSLARPPSLLFAREHRCIDSDNRERTRDDVCNWHGGSRWT